MIEVQGPGGVVVEFPDGTSPLIMQAAMQRQFGGPQQQSPPQSWAGYAGGLARQAAQGLTFGFGDEIEAGLRSALGDRPYADIVADIRRSNEGFAQANPIASTTANIAGGVVPFVAGPGAVVARMAVGSTLPRTIARSAGVGAGAGGVSGLGTGEGTLAERLPSAGTGAVLGAGLGAALPPVVAGVSRVAGAAAPVLSHLTRRRPTEPPLPFNAYSHPIEGARFIADGGTPPAAPAAAEIASGQERAILALRDAMLRGGTSPDELQALIAEASAAAKPHSSGQAQTATVLGDLNDSLTRLAGVFARQSPEAARDISQTMSARQTGITPMGADQAALAQRGIPSAPRLAEPITGRQAQARFGTHFGAGQDNQVPMGSRDRIRDWLERLNLIKDKKYHGFGRTGIETMEQAAERADRLAKANYDAARKAHAMANFRQQIDNVFDDALTTAAAKEAPTVEKVLSDAHNLFRPGKPINLEQFDNTKRVLDNRIKALLADPDTVHAGGLLNDVKNRLVTAIDDATGGAEKSLYAKARNVHANEMQNMQAYLAGRHVYTEDQALRRTGPLAELIADENAAIRYFHKLGDDVRPTGNGTETFGELRQKLWRQGHTDALVAKLPRNVNRSGLQLFNEDRVQRLIRETAPSGSAARAEQLGRYIDFEGRMPETKHVATGNSLTAMRAQDDLMAIATEASQNVQGIMAILRGNQSLFQLGERLVTAAWDRAFGVGAEAAREGARMLFTANPAEISAILQQVAARWPASRMDHFNRLMESAQRYISSSAALAGGAAGSPTPVASNGPVSF